MRIRPARRVRRALIVLFAPLAAACGAGAPGEPAAPAPSVTEVRIAAAPADAPAAAQQDDGPAEARDAARKPKSLARCVEELRNARLEEPGQGASGRDRYAEALAHEKAGELDAARKSYLALIQNAPTSPYIPLGYLAFGELFFAEADRDPTRLEFAMQAYQEVAKYPPPKNVAWIYANYRMASIRRRTGDGAAALASLKKTVDGAAQHPALPCSASILERARADIVEVYAEVGHAARARDFFRAVSGERAQDPSPTLDMLVRLAEIHAAAGRVEDAVDSLLGAPAGGAAEGFCRREGAVLQRLERSPSLGPAQQQKVAQLAPVHAARCPH